MNMKKYVLCSAVAGMMLAGCADLDTVPLGDTITADQKEQVVADNPDMVAASVAGITTLFSSFMAFFDEYHSDFGFPSSMLTMDSRGIDMVGLNVGYNWFVYALTMSDYSNSAVDNSMLWQTMYRQIYAANNLISVIPTTTDNDKLQFYLAQGLAIRAFDYFVLAQMYQFTYEGNTDAPCVPLILDTNASTAATDGIARNTVGEVYAQIMSDLNNAVNLLKASSFTRADKRYVSYEVAVGLRARVELVMQDWDAAAKDAQEAISNSQAQPISILEAKAPGFLDMNEPNWMWGIYIDETDDVVNSGIVNWPSHMGSLNYGYASVGAWRKINADLYARIPATDVRKGWWLDANGNSPNLDDEQASFLKSSKAPAYTQVKFAPYGGEVYTAVNANDIMLMRIEEMHLIKAEAQAMGSAGPAVGLQTLTEFVQKFRDPAYSPTASSPAAVQEAVWMQRRLELWGEGLSYFDLMRLRKGIDRRKGGFEAEVNFLVEDTKAAERASIERVKAGQGGVEGTTIQRLIYQIPNSETEANALINASDNNLSSPQLTPVAD